MAGVVQDRATLGHARRLSERWSLSAVVDANLGWLAVVGVVLAVVGAFYYLRVIWYMYFAEAEDQAPLTPAFDLKLVISLNCLALLALGMLPGALLELCARAL